MSPPINQPINPPIHPYTHPKVGVSPQIINLQTELNYLNYVKIYSFLVISHEPTYEHTQPPTHRSPQISNLQKELKYLDSFKTYWIFTDLGVPLWGWVGGGWQCGWVGAPSHMCTQTCRCMNTHVNHDKHVVSHLQFLYMYILACTCVCVCVCVCMYTCVSVCGGHSPYPQIPHIPLLPLPELWGDQISTNARKLEQTEVIQFSLKIWDLCTFLHLFR